MVAEAGRLYYRTIITGMVELPSSDGPNHHHPFCHCSRTHCFCFSDGSASVCCDIDDFSLGLIGGRINVLAWNFIPMKHSSGFLEIFRWILDSGGGLIRHSNVSAFPSVHRLSPSPEDSSKSCCNVHGVLISTSPVSLVSCELRPRECSISGAAGSTNLSGFVAEIRICKCKFWNSKGVTVTEVSDFNGCTGHSFRDCTFVYFCGSYACWHPLLHKLIDCVVLLFGLRKKLVFVGKESQLMYVSSMKSSIHLSTSRNPFYAESVIKWQGELGTYTGIVRGIYMNGKIVELDKEMWLVIDDELIIVPHGLRVGAIVSVVNVHFHKVKFAWGNVLVLGACIKTEVIESFSPLGLGTLQFLKLKACWVTSLDH